MALGREQVAPQFVDHGDCAADFFGPCETQFAVCVRQVGLRDYLGDIEDVDVAFGAGVFAAEGCGADDEEGSAAFGFFRDL